MDDLAAFAQIAPAPPIIRYELSGATTLIRVGSLSLRIAGLGVGRDEGTVLIFLSIDFIFSLL